MTSFHYAAIAVSIAILVIGSIGFLRKKWPFWKFYTIGWIGMALFGFGILPTQFPDWSLVEQIAYILIISAAGYFFIRVMLKYLLGRKLM